MKKNKILPLLVIAFVAIAALFSSCSKKDEAVDNLPPNTMFVQSRAYAITRAKIEDKGERIKIKLKSNVDDIDVSITCPKAAIGIRLDLSQRGKWEFDGEVVEAKGWEQVLAEGSYVDIYRYDGDHISLSYRVRQLKSGNVEAGNYSGRVTVKHDD